MRVSFTAQQDDQMRAQPYPLSNIVPIFQVLILFNAPLYPLL